MNYLLAIRAAVLFFPLVLMTFLIPYFIYQYSQYKRIDKFKIFLVVAFILYILIMYFLIILPLPKIGEVKPSTSMIRLVPFTFIKDFLQETSFNILDYKTYIKAVKEPCFYTVIFNLVMMIPLGIYLRCYFNLNLKYTILITFSLSLFFEFTQGTGLYYIYPYPYRVFDVDDLLLNTLGGIIGYKLIDL